MSDNAHSLHAVTYTDKATDVSDGVRPTLPHSKLAQPCWPRWRKCSGGRGDGLADVQGALAVTMATTHCTIYRRLHGTVPLPVVMGFKFHKLTLGSYVHNHISKHYTTACVAR